MTKVGSSVTLSEVEACPELVEGGLKRSAKAAMRPGFFTESILS